MIGVLFGGIFFVARGCVATQEATQVRKYVSSSESLLSDSENLGNERLRGVLQSANGDPAGVDAGAVEQVAEEAQGLYQQALANQEVPREFRDAHPYLVSSLGIRSEATEELRRAATGRPENFPEALSRVVGGYRVSDGTVAGYYVPSSLEALEAAGQRSDRATLYDPEPFMDYDALGFGGISPDDPAQAVQPNATHGVEVAGVEVAGTALRPGGNVTLAGPDTPTFAVTVENAGEVAEVGVPVEVTLNTVAERQSQEATIERLEPGESRTVEIAGFRPGEFNEAAEVSVEAGPVDYEDFLDNNEVSGTVTFGV